MVKVFVLGDLIHQLGSAKLYIWVLQVLHITTSFRKQLGSSRLQNIYRVPLYLTAYPSFWLNYFYFGHNRVINVCLFDLYWIFLSGKSLGTCGRIYISPFRDFQHAGNLICQSTNIYNTIRNVFFFPTHWNNCGSWFWGRNKEIIGEKIRFCCDNAYSLTTRIMSNETSIFFYPQLFGHFF